MALNTLRMILVVGLIVSLLGSLIPVETVYALRATSSSDNLPALATFVEQVRNDQADQLRGLYVPELFAFPVIQQPADDYGFVSPRDHIVTQFGLASRFGSTGLLAHNHLAGQHFLLFEKNQIFHLVYGDGAISTFVVTEILEYQALAPESPSSRFISLQDGALKTAPELFSELYHNEGKVILQTCISKGSQLTWGRLFIIAEPYFGAP
ncbi:MAG TPA: hypothetical protein VK900_08430 [Anaerolineales bacterium]|nr:hypothetical protein [Anaerolineales bacterium]